MPSLDPRARIVTELMSAFVQRPSPERVQVYLKHLSDIDTDLLRAACAGTIEHGQPTGVPRVVDIRRRAEELRRGRNGFLPIDEPTGPHYRECRKRTHRTAVGNLLCCREEGHAGDCESWFDHGGPRPEDEEIIAKLLAVKPRGNWLEETT